MIAKSVIIIITTLFISIGLDTQETGKLKDSRDKKIYKTVKIDKQTWMAENLAYKSKTGCWAYEYKESNVAIYGYLYDWETANKVCPSGWHLPTDAEWTTLTTYLGGEETAGNKIKSVSGWIAPASKANNSSGFTALPGGSLYNFNGEFSNAGFFGYWWTATSADDKNAWDRYIINSDSSIDRISREKINGFSVRCVKD